jgi:hypothetical protein
MYCPHDRYFCDTFKEIFTNYSFSLQMDLESQWTDVRLDPMVISLLVLAQVLSIDFSIVFLIKSGILKVKTMTIFAPCI